MNTIRSIRRVLIGGAVLLLPVAVVASQITTLEKPPVNIIGKLSGNLLNVTQTGKGAAVGISSSQNEGLYSTTSAPNHNALNGSGTGGATGVLGQSDTGTGVLAISGGAYPFGVFNTNSTALLQVDSSGNLYIAGRLHQQVSANADGEGRLVNGVGIVRFDTPTSEFLSRIKAYVVTLTPESDSKGLFLAERNIKGFLVRENGGGRSTMLFTYHLGFPG